MRFYLKLILLLAAVFFYGTKTFAQQQKNNPKSGDTLYNSADIMPQFPGGDMALYKYLNDSLRYPPMAYENRIDGDVKIGFVVAKDGSIEQVEIMGKKRGWGLDEEAIRLVAAMPRWTPGSIAGAKVNVKLIVPVVFYIK